MKTQISIIIIIILLYPIILYGQQGAWYVSHGKGWSDEDEKAYENFTEILGRTKHKTFAQFIHDPNENPLFEPSDLKLKLEADCADLPYFVRAYVAYKRNLPFVFSVKTSDKNPDQKGEPRPDGKTRFSQNDFNNVQDLFEKLRQVNSRSFLEPPSSEESDIVPTTISSDTIKPGTIFVDPNGHIALVASITPDGRIRFIDSHPDQTLTKPWFGPQFASALSKSEGGFKKWRQISQNPDGKISLSKNPKIFSSPQPPKEFSTDKDIENLNNFEAIQKKLAKEIKPIDPKREFIQAMEEVFEEIIGRKKAVDKAVLDGIAYKPHPNKLPPNIFVSNGEWKNYSTPNRDIRLKKAFKNLLLKTEKLIEMAEKHDETINYKGGGRQLAEELLEIYEKKSSEMKIEYENSKGEKVTLNFHDISNRLWDLSFDPYHSPELRWGAKGAERETAKDDPIKQKWYDLERKLRNQIEPILNQPTPPEIGPEVPPEFDVKELLMLLRDSLSNNSSKNATAKTYQNNALDNFNEWLKVLFTIACLAGSFYLFLLLLLAVGKDNTSKNDSIEQVLQSLKNSLNNNNFHYSFNFCEMKKQSYRIFQLLDLLNEPPREIKNVKKTPINEEFDTWHLKKFSVLKALRSYQQQKLLESNKV